MTVINAQGCQVPKSQSRDCGDRAMVVGLRTGRRSLLQRCCNFEWSLKQRITSEELPVIPINTNILKFLGDVTKNGKSKTAMKVTSLFFFF